MELFTFPTAPNPKASEWPGTPIGTGNVITRARRRTAIRDTTIDRIDGRRNELVGAAVEHIVRRADAEPIWVRDAVIHGVRVRVITNSPHLYEFWAANCYSPQGWRGATHLAPPQTPRVTVYALGGVADQQEAVYYSRRTDTIVLFNTSYYDELRAAVLGAVGRVLAEDWGIHLVRGACVELGGRGMLYLGPVGIGKSTLAYGFVAERPDARVCADDWVYVRYAVATRDGGRLVPFEVRPAHGRVVRGYRVFRWLEDHRGASGQVRGFDLRHTAVTAPVAALDLAKPIAAYAYPAERAAYARTALVAGVPSLARGIRRARFENVPDVTPEWLEARAAEIDALADAASPVSPDGDAGVGGAGDPGHAVSREALRLWLARLLAFDGARVIQDPAEPLLAGHVVVDPTQGVPLSTVAVLRRDVRDRTVLHALAVEPFVVRLLIGETADVTREIAYNPDRAVDSEAERAAVARLETEAARQGEGPQPLYHEFRRHPVVPETLAQEFEFLRLLHRATRCYDVNAILASDPEVRDLREAVARTAALTVYAMTATDEHARADLDDYRQILAVAGAPS
ncbi:MAG TPA: hypothetical protein VEZ44_00375 [bacterium]|nr:hypothetical protein [bacterium]